MATSRTSRRARGPAPGISRIDQDSTRTHGYYARVGYVRPRGGSSRPRHVAFFGDRSHGGKRAALAAAERWVRGVRRELGRVHRGAKPAAKAPAKAVAKAGARRPSRTRRPPSR